MQACIAFLVCEVVRKLLLAGELLLEPGEDVTHAEGIPFIPTPDFACKYTTNSGHAWTVQMFG
jgi:hypothetical protein